MTFEQGYTDGYYRDEAFGSGDEYMKGHEQGKIHASLGVSFDPTPRRFELSKFDFLLAGAYAMGFHHGMLDAPGLNPYGQDLWEMEYVYKRGYIAATKACAMIDHG